MGNKGSQMKNGTNEQTDNKRTKKKQTKQDTKLQSLNRLDECTFSPRGFKYTSRIITPDLKTL